MQYITLENLQSARLKIVKPIETTEDHAYLDGWNDCIDALMNLVEESRKPYDGFLSALANLGTRDAENVEYPDCEECSFSGLLTDE